VKGKSDKVGDVRRAHHLSMVSIGFAVASGWVGSSIITVARRGDDLFDGAAH
jgi:hypothetical protein